MSVALLESVIPHFIERNQYRLFAQTNIIRSSSAPLFWEIDKVLGELLSHASGKQKIKSPLELKDKRTQVLTLK